MTIAQRIGAAAITAEQNVRSKEFVAACKLLALGGRHRANAVGLAEQQRATSRILDVVKAAATPMTLGGELGAFQLSANAFFSSLAGASAFDTMLPFMQQVPLRTRVVAVSSAITGTGSLSEATIKPVSSLTVSASDLDIRKAAGQVVLTEELLRDVNSNAFFENELRNAVAVATDTQFLSLITAGATSIPSSGTNANGARLDIRALLQAITIGPESRLFLITTPAIASAWSLLGDSNGAMVFPNATYNGGSIAGVTVIASSGATASTIVLVDATAIAAAQEAARVDTTTQGSVQMDTSPDSPLTASTNLLSLWANDLRALRVERFFSAKPARSNGVAQITGASFTGGSPS